MTSHSAQYWFTEIALRAHALSFEHLEKQMDEFQPLPPESFSQEWQKLWDDLRPLNLDKSEEDFRNFIDSQVILSSEEQFNYKFRDQFAAESITITVLSHALVEATINAILALGLEYVGKHNLFLMLEKSEVKHKWTIGPQSFLPNYNFPKSNALFEVLSTLCRRRNSYVHSKITLRDEGNQVLLTGSTDAALSFDQGSRRMLHRFLTLPYELHQLLVRQIEDPTLQHRLKHILKGTRD